MENKLIKALDRQRVCITIPVYSTKINQFEKLSILQCIEVFKDIPIILVAPKSLNTSLFENIITDHLLRINRFPNKYFQSLQTYNRLLTSLQFFEALSDFDFFLMYQTDAYVFRNELQYWCDKEYDYIGAPIYEFDGTIHPPEENYLGVGNGGFSLHKISSAIKVLKTFRKVYPFKDLWQWYSKYNWKGRTFYLPYFIRIILGLGGNSHHLLNYSRINEDLFWGKYIPQAFPEFKVAPFEEAYKFSMEYNCDKLLKLNKGKLPFGTHQWFKGKFFEFWKPYIYWQV